MKKKLKIKSFVLAIMMLFSSIQLTNAQDITREELSRFGDSNLVPSKSASKTIGSPYLSDNFLKGKIMLTKNSATQTLFLRFNMEKNMVQFLKGDQIMVADNKNFKGFRIFTKQDNDIIFKNGFNIHDEDINRNTLLRVIYDRGAELLVYYKAYLKKDLATYGTATKKNKYEVNKRYYLKVGDNDFKKIKLNKDDILSALSNKEEQIKTYIQNRSVDFDEESDVANLLAYYDKL